MTEASTPVEVFCTYAPEDKSWCQKIETHLATLQQQGLVSLWHEGLITPGRDRIKDIDSHLETASIILWLVSAEFLASDKYDSAEMQHALERQKKGEARIVPIPVRPVDWKSLPFAHLQTLPTNAQPIQTWEDQEIALVEITKGIRRMIEEVRLASTSSVPRPALQISPAPRPAVMTGRPSVPRRSVLIGGAAVIASIGASVLLILQASHQADPTKPNPLLRFVYQGHSNSVHGVAWSPDGMQIASSSNDKTVQVWNTNYSSRVFTYTGHGGSVYRAVWSPKGARIASGSGDKTVQVWNANDGSHVLTYRGHYDQVYAVVWSPDGQRIASGSSDKTVQVWNANDGSHFFTYIGHTGQVDAIVWSPDGQRIASGSGDTTVQVWNANDGSHFFTYTGHSNWVQAVAVARRDKDSVWRF